jgi:hypothetical protein
LAERLKRFLAPECVFIFGMSRNIQSKIPTYRLSALQMG